MLLILDNRVTANDNLAFTKELIKTLKIHNVPYLLVNSVQEIDKNKIKGIIITGSSLKLSQLEQNGEFQDYGFNLYYLSILNVPVFGICFGCQLLNILYGGKLIDNKKFICDDITFHDFKNINQFFNHINTRSFRYCFSDIVIPSKKLDIDVFASIQLKNRIIDCGFIFEKGRVFGSLFHPEFYPETTGIFYKNFYDFCKKYKK
jgi:anthranilate/para-aminobenzoate synthase component II